MRDLMLKYFASANVLVLSVAFVTKAWSQDPSPPPASGDERDQVVQVCMAEAKARGEKLGARDVSMRKVEDTDKKSDGRASVRAEVDVAIPDKDGKLKMKKMTFKCDTRHGTVTAFSYD